MTETHYECPFCGTLKPSPNGTGSDVSCCDEVGHSLPVEPQDEALSASPLSQADSPSEPALRVYRPFSAFVQRIWICSVARSFGGRGGLPLPRFGAFMAVIMPTQIIVDKAPC